MDRKYEFTGETREWWGTTLHRIRAVRDILPERFRAGVAPRHKAWDLGGWIEKEDNLSHEGTAWVSGEAMVWGSALVTGHSWVSGRAWVYERALVGGNAEVFEDALVHGDAQVLAGRIGGVAEIEGCAVIYMNGTILSGWVVEPDEIAIPYLLDTNRRFVRCYTA